MKCKHPYDKQAREQVLMHDHCMMRAMPGSNLCQKTCYPISWLSSVSPAKYQGGTCIRSRSFLPKPSSSTFTKHRTNNAIQPAPLTVS